MPEGVNLITPKGVSPACPKGSNSRAFSTYYTISVRDDGFVHLIDSLERAIAILQYVGMVEMGVGSEKQPITVKL